MRKKNVIWQNALFHLNSWMMPIQMQRMFPTYSSFIPGKNHCKVHLHFAGLPCLDLSAAIDFHQNSFPGRPNLCAKHLKHGNDYIPLLCPCVVELRRALNNCADEQLLFFLQIGLYLLLWMSCGLIGSR